MSFSLKYRTLRSGSIYDLHTHPEVSTDEEQTAAAAGLNEAERNHEINTRFSANLIEERIKASLEPLHAQIFALKQMMDKLI